MFRLSSISCLCPLSLWLGMRAVACTEGWGGVALALVLRTVSAFVKAPRRFDSHPFCHSQQDHAFSPEFWGSAIVVFHVCDASKRWHRTVRLPSSISISSKAFEMVCLKTT